jgi:transposase
LTTKIHVAVTPEWHLHSHGIGTGAGADISQAPKLTATLKRNDCVIAARAYDSDAFVSALTERGVETQIPPRKNRREARAWSRSAYNKRHGVENYFARLKHFRRLVTRFEKRVPMLRGFFYLANACVELSITFLANRA